LHRFTLWGDTATVAGMILVVAATERELAGAAGAATLACGIGPVEAAAATARALAELRPDALLHVGIAGARGIPVPQLVIGSEAVYEDALAGGLVPERVRPDPRLVDAAQRALPAARVLPIGTSARVGGTSDCEVEAMEGFAVLRAARIAGVPAVEVRAVSNEIDEPDRGLWRFDDALAALDAAVPRLLSAFDE
jgi:futalosine hydrolase